MCGFAGILDSRQSIAGGSGQQDRLGELLEPMVAAVSHRGPDSAGYWYAPNGTLALGHRRLAVIDLSEEGHQPMVSRDGRWVIVYNGEIYNHSRIRRELLSGGAILRGHSDTEILVESLARNGLDQTVAAINGMFAFAAWDQREQSLWLCRDRLGIKPLYYGCWQGRLVFGSEVGCLFAGSRSRPPLDRSAIAAYLKHGYIPAPRSVYEGITKLPPGSLVQIPADGIPVGPRAYWSLSGLVEDAISQRGSTGQGDLLDDLEQAIEQAVVERLVADVPVGTFLSGGIDSSVVTALAARNVTGGLQTFSVGFDDPRIDESRHAAEIARFLATEHRQVIVTGSDALQTVPDLAKVWDEPFGDSSQIPMLLVSRLAREHVTVTLSGDGGDELFGGYARYRNLLRLNERLRAIPAWFRPALSRLATLGGQVARGRLGHRCELLSGFLSQPDGLSLYRCFHSHWKRPEAIVQHATVADDWATGQATWPNQLSLTESMMFLDTLHYLPDDILTKVDRATMSVGLEARVPLLDPRVIAAAWRMPSDGPVAKHWLKELAYRLVPRELLERPKLGFGVPLAEWLRGPLRPWAEDLLSAQRLEDQGLLISGPIRRLWNEHASGRSDWAYYLWDVLMLESWLDHHSD